MTENICGNDYPDGLDFEAPASQGLDLEYPIRRGIERRCAIAVREINEAVTMVALLSHRFDCECRTAAALRKLRQALADALPTVDAAVAQYDELPAEAL